MRRGLPPQGYTIIEVLIFLTVSAGLFVSGAMLLSGQQGKTEFAQAIRETNSQIQDIINDTATGYYPRSTDFKCTAGNPPTISSGVDSLGTNEGCIFIGRAMHFGIQGSDGAEFDIYTVVGNRQNTTTVPATESQGFTAARPTALDPATHGDRRTLPYGLKVKKMTASGAPIGAVGFFSSFGEHDSGSGDLVSGAQSAIQLVPVPGSSLDQDSGAIATAISSIVDGTPTNPDSGVIICFESAGTSQYGIITIGGGGQRTSSTVEVVDMASAPAECV